MLRSKTWLRKMQPAIAARLLAATPGCSLASAVACRRDNYLSRFDIACDIDSEPNVMVGSWCRRGCCDWSREAQFFL
jgi:hypothetical protein